ncbi:hypothetical protein HFO02_22695 [Rhizobium laguerreae]|uniref:hypothetical protein n=1 Tax=Rhizobium laguerreae TaxID=1076926 RepID=UPI001C9290E7|nr:hypothetical protein [Rhizobium laguerreae]MBY3326383.1 hypothetical protein [Rhizobium laguerreae]
MPSIQGTNGLVGAKYNQSDAENGKQAEQSYAKNRESNQFEHQHLNVVRNGCESVRLDDEGASDCRSVNRTLRTAVICLVILSGLATVPSPVLAQPASSRIPLCVDAFKPDLSPNPAPALDPMRTFAVVLGPYRFSVPWVFLSGRPRANLQSCELGVNKLAIQFRYNGDVSVSSNEIDYSYGGVGFGNDAPSDFVEIQALQFYDRAPQDYFDPSLRYKNTIRAVTTAGSVKVIDGLEEIKPGWAATEGTHWHRATDETEVFISCDLISLCTGFLNLRDLHFSAHITLKQHSVREIRKIDATLRSLISNWRQNQ